MGKETKTVLSVFKKCDGTSDISWGPFFVALLRLERATKGIGPYACIMHENQWDILKKSVATEALLTQTPKCQDEVKRGFYVGTALLVDIYTTTDLTVDACGKMWQRDKK